MWSRSRRLGLETVSRRINVSSRSHLDQNAQRLGLVSDLCVSDIVSVSTQNVSASRLGSRTISSCRDVSCRRAQLNYNSPMKTSRPMTYSVGRVLGTVCLLIFPLLIYREHHKSLKTVIPDELSKRDLLSLLWRIIWSLFTKWQAITLSSVCVKWLLEVEKSTL